MNRIRHNPRLLVIAASVFFTGMAACIKAASPDIPLYELVFFRSAISALVLGLLLWGRKMDFRARNLSLLVTRSLSGFLAMSCNFYALGHLPFGDAAMLVSTFPIFVAVLSFLFLGERPTRSLWILIAASWAGILLILRPQFHFWNFAGLIALLAAVLSAVVVIVIHQSHESDPSLRIAFYFTATCAFLALPVMLQRFVTPNLRETLLLTASGLLGTAGQIAITRAYGFEEVSRLAPLAYTGVVLSFLFGLIFWNEIPTAWSILGGSIVILCCILIARREKPTPVIE